MLAGRCLRAAARSCSSLGPVEHTIAGMGSFGFLRLGLNSSAAGPRALAIGAAPSSVAANRVAVGFDTEDPRQGRWHNKLELHFGLKNQAGNAPCRWAVD